MGSLEEMGRELAIEKFKYCYHSYLQRRKRGCFHVNPYGNCILVDKLSDTNKGWKDALFIIIGDIKIPSLDIPSTPTQQKKWKSV